VELATTASVRAASRIPSTERLADDTYRLTMDHAGVAQLAIFFALTVALVIAGFGGWR
jgi:hypothetical protein